MYIFLYSFNQNGNYIDENVINPENAQNYNVCVQSFWFLKNCKSSRKKNIMKSANFFVVIVYIVHREDAHRYRHY